MKRWKRKPLAARVAPWTMLLVGLSAAVHGPDLRAQDPAPGEGITVFGTGEVGVRPNWVEIDLQVSGKAELTGDALVKYRDAHSRLIEALNKLALDNLETQERGVQIVAGSSLSQQQRIMNGMPQNPGKPQIDVASTVRVRLKDVREVPTEELVKTIGRLIDVAQDAGVDIGISGAEMQMRQRYGVFDFQGTAVRFVVADLDALREKAYEAAVEDARRRAARLARLNGLKLGSAVSVQEIKVAGDEGQSPKPANPFWPAFLSNSEDEDPRVSQQPRISSKTLAEIPVTVKLQVRFAIEPADAATAQN